MLDKIFKTRENFDGPECREGDECDCSSGNREKKCGCDKFCDASGGPAGEHICRDNQNIPKKHLLENFGLAVFSFIGFALMFYAFATMYTGDIDARLLVGGLILGVGSLGSAVGSCNETSFTSFYFVLIISSFIMLSDPSLYLRDDNRIPLNYILPIMIYVVVQILNLIKY